MSLSPTEIRNYRPSSWDDFVGEANWPHLDRLQKLAVTQQLFGRYLLTAPYGSAKTSLGRFMVKTACCPNIDSRTGDPCGTCDSCKRQGPDYNGEGRPRTHWEIDCTRTPRAEANEILDDLRAKRDAVVFWDEFHRYDHLADMLLKTSEDHEGLWIISVAEGRQNSELYPLWERFRTVRLRTPTPVELVAHFQQKLPHWGVTAPLPTIEHLVSRSNGSFRGCLNVIAVAAESQGRTLDDATVDEVLDSEHTASSDYLIPLD